MICSWLRRSGDIGDPSLNLHCFDPGGSILGGWNAVAAEQKKVVDPVMGGEGPWQQSVLKTRR